MSNYTYHGTRDLIALPGRSVQTFPSGLVRVDRTYACRAADAGRFRQQFAVGNPLPFDDGTPAIDGMFIFPDAQEEVGDDGFIQFSVSAYGRTNVSGYDRREFVQGTANILRISTSAGQTTQQESNLTTLNESIVRTFVLPSEQPFAFNIGVQQNELKVYLPDGRLITEAYPPRFTEFGGNSYSQTNSGSIAVFGGTQTTNFGRWTEVRIVYNSNGFVSIVSFRP
jgi:hypothetical protein